MLSQITNGGTNAGSHLRVVRNLFTGSDQLSYTCGRHGFSLGGWVQRIQSNDSLVQDQYGQTSFTNLQTFLEGQVSTFTYAPSYTPLGWRSTEGAAFAEDAIKIKSNLELRLGFRTEFTNGWKEAQGRASNYAFDSNGVILTEPVIRGSALAVNNAKFLPAPRAAAAWSPLGSTKTVIRAGFGTYYTLLDNLSSPGSERSLQRGLRGKDWNPNFNGKVILGGPNEYFSPLAFIQPLAETYGNVGRNILEGPSLKQFDLALAKRWSLSERVNLQFRSDFFNLFNHTNLNTPNPVVYAGATGGPSPTVGVITSTATTSRQVRLGLKLLWYLPYSVDRIPRFRWIILMWLNWRTSG